jgi:hypothetical protein
LQFRVRWPFIDEFYPERFRFLHDALEFAKQKGKYCVIYQEDRAIIRWAPRSGILYLDDAEYSASE